MKRWAKRIGAAALVLAGVLLYLRHLLQLLDWPHLYPDLGQLSMTNILFLGLTLLLLGLAWISAAYLLLNTKLGVLRLLVPAAAFVLLLTLSGLCLTRGVGEIPCSYTKSLAVCREEFDPQSFRIRGRSLYQGFLTGELSGYAKYEKGEVLAEAVTRSFDQDEFNGEAARLANLGLDAFRPKQDPREREIVCYELRMGDTLWQVLVVPKTKSVTYSRFHLPERLPSFAPQPTTAAPEPVY